MDGLNPSHARFPGSLYCTGLPGHGTTRATRICCSLGGVDLRQFGPPDRHVKLPDRVHRGHESNQSSLVDSNPVGGIPLSGSGRGPNLNATEKCNSSY